MALQLVPVPLRMSAARPGRSWLVFSSSSGAKVVESRYHPGLGERGVAAINDRVVGIDTPRAATRLERAGKPA